LIILLVFVIGLEKARNARPMQGEICTSKRLALSGSHVIIKLQRGIYGLMRKADEEKHEKQSFSGKKY
jgi:hypothetical protein